MKLNKLNKEAIIRRIMSDVPETDYRAQAQVVLDADMITTTPGALVHLLKDKDLRTYLITGHHTVEIGKPYNSSQWGTTLPVYRGYEKSEAAKKALEPIVALATAQLQARGGLRTKVKASIDGCNTRAQVLTAFPEFEKYLPDDPPKVNRTLPALSNLVADLSKAGWPK